MGCVSSSLLNQDEELSQMGMGMGHHIVSLTSSTYGLLTGLDHHHSHPHPHPHPHPLPSSTSSPVATPATAPGFLSPLSESRAIRSEPEVINSWELMAGLDSNDSFRFSPFANSNSNSNSRPCTPKFFKPSKPRFQDSDKENCQPNRIDKEDCHNHNWVLKYNDNSSSNNNNNNNNIYSLDGFPNVCPPNGEDKVVLYTTTLRGVRRTFEACNAVRSALQALGFSFCERDISMDRGFRDELTHLLRHHNSCSSAPPRLFIKGRYVGGAEEVLPIHEEGRLAHLLQGQGLPRLKPGLLCDGCGGFTFLPCFRCHGSCKLTIRSSHHSSTLVIRCPDCNENGLVLCPICT